MNYLNQTVYFCYQLVLQNILSTGLVTLTCLLLIAAYTSSKNKQKFWTERGVKGPSPLPFVGNLLSLYASNGLKKELEWAQKYGKVYGVYYGTSACLVVADPEILQQVCVQDFDVFPNHDMGDYSLKYVKSFLAGLRDEHWKRTRALMSPTFTSSKIKRMFRFLDNCTEDLVKCFGEQLPSDKPKQEQKAKVNVKDLYCLFTMDAITTCCYGLKLERAAGATNLKAAASRNDALTIVMMMFEFNIPRVLISMIFPGWFLRFINFTNAASTQLDPLANMVQSLINRRRGSEKRKFDDYLQLLIDAKLNNKLELNEMDAAENHHAGLTSESLLQDQRQLISDIGDIGDSKTTLSDLDILSNAMIMMAVGLETTATLLAHCTYALAFHSEVQEQLNEELLKIVELDEHKRYQFDYDSLTACKYLDAVLSESLRIMPPVIQFERVSNRDYYLKKYNITLPPNTKVNLAYYAILNHQDYWPEPERFDPERFMPANKDKIVPGSYCPFGFGPRHCFGMRFSLTEAKLAIAKMVLNYRFEPVPGLKFPPESTRMLILNNIKTPLVIVKPRI